MFSKFFAILALGAGAVCAISTATINDITYSCNTSSIQCCGSLQTSSQYNAAQVASALGVAVHEITGQLGVQCTTVTGIGAGTGSKCASKPVCCEREFQNQGAGINCSPATVGA